MRSAFRTAALLQTLRTLHFSIYSAFTRGSATTCRITYYRGARSIPTAKKTAKLLLGVRCRAGKSNAPLTIMRMLPTVFRGRSRGRYEHLFGFRIETQIVVNVEQLFTNRSR
jgi:hypothetical protein